jgi:hypothetical protein
VAVVASLASPALSDTAAPLKRSTLWHQLFVLGAHGGDAQCAAEANGNVGHVVLHVCCEFGVWGVVCDYNKDEC